MKKFIAPITLILVVSTFLFVINFDKIKSGYNTEFHEYVDAPNKTEFSIDSCNQFVTCLVSDFKNNKKDWTYGEDKMYNETFDSEWKEINHVQDSLSQNFINLNFMGGVYQKADVKFYSNKTFKITKEIKDLNVNYPFGKERTKTIYNVYLVKKDSTVAFRKKDGEVTCVMTDRPVELNPHESYFIGKIFNQVADADAKELKRLQDLETQKQQAIASKAEARQKFVNDSLNKVELKNLHDTYFPTCKQ